LEGIVDPAPLKEFELERLLALTNIKHSPVLRKREGRTPKMNSLHPDSAAAMTAHRREAVRLAEEQQKAVAERCKRSNQQLPDYSFEELIGKGSFGRVYKG
jgi:outer membrane protein TolC